MIFSWTQSLKSWGPHGAPLKSVSLSFVGYFGLNFAQICENLERKKQALSGLHCFRFTIFEASHYFFLWLARSCFKNNPLLLLQF